MALSCTAIPSLVLLLCFQGAIAAKFTFVNNCEQTVWPGILGTPTLDATGFELAKGTSRTFQAPTGWSGRFWGRTGCTFDDSGQGSCLTGDCGSGQMECNGEGAEPPATLAEFTLGTAGSQDFYDVSLVDGFNSPHDGGCEWRRVGSLRAHGLWRRLEPKMPGGAENRRRQSL
nr:pathogenesis-related protein 5-like [Ipomoea batatas]